MWRVPTATPSHEDLDLSFRSIFSFPKTLFDTVWGQIRARLDLLIIPLLTGDPASLPQAASLVGFPSLSSFEPSSYRPTQPWPGLR